MLRVEQMIQPSYVATGRMNNSYRSPGGARGLKGDHNFTAWWVRFSRDWPCLTWRGGTWGLSVLLSAPPPFSPYFTCRLYLTHRFSNTVLHTKHPPNTKKVRALLTVSKWASCGRGEESRGETWKLHRDFFFLSPVTIHQFTPHTPHPNAFGIKT